MTKTYWERCPFHESRQCPQETVVDRLVLVPQFLSPREREAAMATCQSCEKRLAERRRHRRTRRFLTGLLFTEEGAPFQAKILDVSEGGALLELDGWAHFEQGEKASLEIHPTSASPPGSSRPPIKVVGLVKRVEPEKRRLAIAFLDAGDS
jgi:hypothetical protein